MSNTHLVPTRKAPSLEDALRKQRRDNPHKILSQNSCISSNLNASQKNEKKKPPPRPPPPNFEKIRSKSAWSLLNQPDHTINLIEWSPPSSPRAKKFNGSISSSFSSSTSSLASSKKSFESESVQNDWMQVAGSTFYSKLPANGNKVGPTIIRPQSKKTAKLSSASGRSSAATSRDVSPLPSLNSHPSLLRSPPMPNMPPPSPPKSVNDDNVSVEPFGIALYDYSSDQIGDLEFQTDDIVYLLRNVNDDWFYGRVDDREGMFPKNFVDIQSPLEAEEENVRVVKAIFDFVGQFDGDLSFRAGDSIQIIRIIDVNWLYGRCNGNTGQFPANFVNNVPQLRENNN